MRLTAAFCALFTSSFAFLLAGCGSSVPPGSLATAQQATLAGHVHGGQQPVSGSLIQLYTVGTTGTGSASSPLLTSSVYSDANGNFNITGLYTCTSATEVYLLATGGNPGLASTNPNLALMTALGPCSALTSRSFIAVNELTTVAATYALSPFMRSPTSIGAGPSDAAALAAGFALSSRFVDPSTGLLQRYEPSIATQQIAELNTLADIEATCINSLGGTAGDSSICGRLFALTPNSSGTAPTDTITALLNIANNPTANVASLFHLLPSTAPYQPTLLTIPADLSIVQSPSANAAAGLQIGPSSLTFPSASIGVAAPSETVVITNPSSTAIALNGITFTGLDSADFTQTNTCGASLAASASCRVTVTFTPTGSSARSASLSIASATPDSPQLVSLTGNSTGIAINGPHGVVDTAIVPIYPGASYDVNLSNTGSSPLVISSIALAGTAFNTETNNCPESLASGASCTISIHSISAGADQLTIQTNDPDFASNLLVFQPANAPTPVFTPSDIFFADTAVGSSAGYSWVYDRSVTVSPSISGPQASDFKVSSADCNRTPPVFTPMGCLSGVTFNPSASGLRSAKLVLDSSGNYLPLAGIGTSPTRARQLSISSYYPYYPIAQDLSVANLSSVSVPVTNLTVQTLTGTPEFTLTNNCGASIAPSQSCRIVVSTTRRVAGGTQALLSISTGSDVYTLTLDDSVYTVIDFGDTAFNNTPTVQASSYPIWSGTSSNPNVGYIGLISDTIAQAPWTSFSFSTCSASSGSCVGEFRFNPTVAGLQTGNASVVKNVGGPSTLQYILIGNGVAAEPAAKLTLKQSGFTSGVNPLGYNPANLTLINLGAHTVTLTGPTITGSDPQNFVFGQASCIQSPGTSSVYPAIAPGAQCTLPLTFNSSMTGFSTATATFTDTTSGLSFSTPLYLATIVGPSVTPASLSFPTTVIDKVSAPQSLTVTRDITRPITAAASGGLVATKGSCAAAENPCVLTFVYAPTSTTIYPSLAITDTTLNAKTVVPVSAQAIPDYTRSSALVSPGLLTFAAQAVGTVSSAQTISIASGGPGFLNLFSISLTGANASDFNETSTCNTYLAVNATCTVNVSFSPASTGSKSASLTISTSANAGTPITVPLSGTAQ